jgi:16S rRNA (cytosine1407-C5)-methyltransferase
MEVRSGNLYPEYFDAILVDAPCSGEGTGFKSDAAYKWWKSESINKIVWLQEHIVTSAIKACKPGWIVIYSTCTLNPFENEMQIAKLLEKYGDTLEILPIDVENKSPGIMVDYEWWVMSDELKKIHNLQFIIQNFLRARPHIHHTGWFFVCVMRKKHSTLKPLQEHITNKKQSSLSSGKYTKTKSVTTPFSYNKQGENTAKKVLQECFGIELDLKTYAIIEWKHKLNLTDASVREILGAWVRLHECGVPLMKPTGKTFSIEHECAIALWHLATKNTIELTTDELQRYCLGEDLTISQERLCNYETMQLCNWYVILMHAWLWVWVGKVIDGTIKNKFFKW